MEDDEFLYDGIPFNDETYGMGEAEAMQTYTFAEATLNELKKLGVYSNCSLPTLEKEHESIFKDLREGDYFDGRLPTVLRSLTLEQLSDLLSLLSAWHAYIASISSSVDIRLAEAAEQKDMAWSLVRMSHWKTAKKMGTNLSDQKLSDLARYDERFVKPNANYVRLNSLKDCVEQIRKICDRNMNMVSRQITVRDVQATVEARGRGVGAWESRETGYKRVGFPGSLGSMVKGKRNVEPPTDEDPPSPPRKRIIEED